MGARARSKQFPIFAGVKKPHPWMAMAKTPEGHPVIHLHYYADDDHDQKWADKEASKTSTQAWWDQEMEMKADAMSGQLIYPEFDEAVHVVSASRLPQRMTRFCAIDPHPRTPHAVLWIGIDEFSDWYVYRELWPSVVYAKPDSIKDDTVENTFTIRDYAETIAVLEGHRLDWRKAETDDEYATYKQSRFGLCPSCGRDPYLKYPSCKKHRNPEKIVYRYMDQAGKGFRASGENEQAESMADRYGRYGIYCLDPIKAHKTGEDAIRMKLKIRHHNLYGPWPQLHVSENCPELVLEFRKHRYKRTKVLNPEKELKQEGVEARCHLLDLLRYLTTGPGVQFIRSLAS